jgi:hypothetical protein
MPTSTCQNEVSSEKRSPLKPPQETEKNVSSLACKNLFDESSTEKGCAGQPSPSEKCDAVESPACASEWANQAQPAHEELQYLNLVRLDISDVFTVFGNILL